MGFLMPKSSTPAAVSSAESTVQQTVPAPEQTAASSQDSNGVATQVGGARKAEDQTLYGTSTPDLRVDRPAVADTLGTSGSGLKLM